MKSTKTDHRLQIEKPMCSQNTEKARFRRAIRRPECFQNASSSGCQSVIHMPSRCAPEAGVTCSTSSVVVVTMRVSLRGRLSAGCVPHMPTGGSVRPQSRSGRDQSPCLCPSGGGPWSRGRRTSSGARCALRECVMDVLDLTGAAAERELHPTELIAILDHIPAVVACWDADLINLFAGRTFAGWFDTTPERIRGMHLRTSSAPRRSPSGKPRFVLRWPAYRSNLNGSWSTTRAASVTCSSNSSLGSSTWSRTAASRSALTSPHTSRPPSRPERPPRHLPSCRIATDRRPRQRAGDASALHGRPRAQRFVAARIAGSARTSSPGHRRNRDGDQSPAVTATAVPCGRHPRGDRPSEFVTDFGHRTQSSRPHAVAPTPRTGRGNGT